MTGEKMLRCRWTQGTGGPESWGDTCQDGGAPLGPQQKWAIETRSRGLLTSLWSRGAGVVQFSGEKTSRPHPSKLKLRILLAVSWGDC